MKHPQKFLEANGLAPQKGFGQNFLTSSHWAEKLCKPILESEHEEIWEIGPGLGALTEVLLRDAQSPVSVFEIDWGLIKYLKKAFPNLTIHEGDILEQDLKSKLSGKRVALISNLPYNISSAVFFRLMELRESIPTLVLTFQREFAERLIAIPSTKAYGAISVLAQYCYDMESLGNLPNGAFYPVPDVVSKAVVFRAKQTSTDSYSELDRLVKAAFRQRRKKLINNLKALDSSRDWETLLKSTSIDPNTRAETLTLDQFLSLLDSMQSKNNG